MSEGPPFPGVGVFYDMPAATYHAVDACSATALKTLAKSAKHLLLKMMTTTDPTPAMMLGTATHTATLEPEKLETTILVAGQCKAAKASGDKCTNSGKVLSGGRWYCGVHAKRYDPDPMPQMLDEDENLITCPVLTQEAFDKAKAMARSIRYDRAARKILESPTAKVEVSFFWLETVTITIDGEQKTFEIPCKMRADIYDPEAPILGTLIADIKSCQCAYRPDFEADIAGRRYDVQAAWYLQGATVATGGVEHKWFKFIAVESAPEHCAAVYRCHPQLVSYGKETWQQLIQLYAYCKATGLWPGYYDHQEKECNLPPWFARQEMNEFKRVDFK